MIRIGKLGSIFTVLFYLTINVCALDSFRSYERLQRAPPCLRLSGGGTVTSGPTIEHVQQTNVSANIDSRRGTASKKSRRPSLESNSLNSPRTKGKDVLDETSDRNISTHSAAAKMMSKMGWSPNKGLGKNMSGILHPLSLNKNKNKAGIGSAAESDQRNEIGSAFQPNNLMSDGAQAFAELSRSIFNMTAWRQAGQRSAERSEAYGLRNEIEHVRAPLSDSECRQHSGVRLARISLPFLSGVRCRWACLNRFAACAQQRQRRET